MEDEEGEHALKGFRSRWSERAKPSSEVGSQADNRERNRSPSFDLELQSKNLDDELAAILRSEKPIESEAQSSAEFEVIPDRNHGSTCSKEASEAMATNAFVRNVSWSNLVLPWESDFMSQIFSDSSLPDQKLSLPSQWNAEVVTARPSKPEVKVPPVPVDAVFSRHVRQIKEETFWEQRSKNSKHAVAKWILFLKSDLSASQVGLQIESDMDAAEDIVLAVLGVKSPGTALKRANSVLSYHRWHSTTYDTCPIPFVESCCWAYIKYLKDTEAPASRATSFVQAVRFSHYIFHVGGSDLVINSRRIIGLADIQLSMKVSTRQARPLSVAEVSRLHQIAGSCDTPLIDRVVATHFLLMIYGRCRASDTCAVERIHHDNDHKTGFVELSTRQHKSSKSAVTKSWLLPIVIPCFGIAEPSWVQSWWECRVEAGLKVSGEIKGPLLPAPKMTSVASEITWTSRPMTCVEMSGMLRSFLGVEDDLFVTSHSMKSATLSWSSKAEMPREYRRILGRHSSAVKEADSVYARDLSFGPVRALERVFVMIRDKSFSPDGQRSQFFPLTPQPGAAPAFPPTPVFQANAPKTPTASLFPDLPGPQEGAVSKSEVVEVKEENSEADGTSGRGITVSVADTIEVSSDSDSASSSEAETEMQSSADEQNGVGHVEPSQKIPRLSESPQLNEVWLQNPSSKIVHAVAVHDAMPGVVPITKCGRRAERSFNSVAVLNDWTAKCRVCFKGRRQPKVG